MQCSDSSAFPPIQSLVGFFELDPNRVLDLVLDAFEAQPAAEHMLLHVRHFKRLQFFTAVF